jgi:hypothetical protein
VLLVVQMWLLTATLETYLAGHHEAAVPGADRLRIAVRGLPRPLRVRPARGRGGAAVSAMAPPAPETRPSAGRPVAPATQAASLKAIALPVEHGGWGMLAEPLVMGLVLAPTLAGLGLTIAALGAFLVRHPLKLALSDWRRGARYPRTVLAARVAAAYGLVALVGLVLAAWRAPAATWLPVVLAAPLGLLQLWYDARLQGTPAAARAARRLSRSARGRPR